MKLSSVWTASTLALTILVASGCAGRQAHGIRPNHALTEPATPPHSQSQTVATPSPAASPQPSAPLEAEPPAQAEVRTVTPVKEPQETALNNSRRSNPASSGKSREVVVKDAPPPPQVEVLGSAPGDSYAWIPGAWQWQDRWVWSGGAWAVKPRSDAVWAKGRWTKRDDGWVWVRGYWR